jgi:hypothetical protein
LLFGEILVLDCFGKIVYQLNWALTERFAVGLAIGIDGLKVG